MDLSKVTIILEGSDCVGKSSFLKALQNSNRLSKTLINHHFQRPEGENHDQELGFYRGQYNLMFDMIRYGNVFLFDRAHISEYVWGPMFRGVQPEYLWPLEQANSDLPIVIIRLHADEDVIIERFKKYRLDEEVPTKDHLKDVQGRYKHFCDRSCFTSIDVDMSNLDQSAITDGTLDGIVSKVLDKIELNTKT